MGSGSCNYSVGGGGGSTSGSTDGGYKGGASNHHSIGDNLDELQSKFEYNNGYFGEKGNGNHMRRIYSDDPLAQAHGFYDTGGFGGIEEPLANGKGVKCTMKDGTVLTMRQISKSDGTPAVNINIKKSEDPSGIKTQKIHFMQKKEG